MISCFSKNSIEHTNRKSTEDTDPRHSPSVTNATKVHSDCGGAAASLALLHRFVLTTGVPQTSFRMDLIATEDRLRPVNRHGVVGGVGTAAAAAASARIQFPSAKAARSMPGRCDQYGLADSQKQRTSTADPLHRTLRQLLQACRANSEVPTSSW